MKEKFILSLFQKQYWERKSLASRRAPNHPVITAYALSKISYLSQYIKDHFPDKTP